MGSVASLHVPLLTIKFRPFTSLSDEGLFATVQSQHSVRRLREQSMQNGRRYVHSRRMNR
jgi:hypothetical protein